VSGTNCDRRLGTASRRSSESSAPLKSGRAAPLSDADPRSDSTVSTGLPLASRYVIGTMLLAARASRTGVRASSVVVDSVTIPTAPCAAALWRFTSPDE